MTLRNIERNQGNITLESLSQAACGFGWTAHVLIQPEECHSEYSTVAVSIRVGLDGFESWKIHFMDLVDEFRRTLDPRLLVLPPVAGLAPELKSLLASIVLELSDETEIDPPEWAGKRYFLAAPWFPAGVESLKASALLESPAYYRRNNIFVLGNFLRRA